MEENSKLKELDLSADKVEDFRLFLDGVYAVDKHAYAFRRIQPPTSTKLDDLLQMIS